MRTNTDKNGTIVSYFYYQYGDLAGSYTGSGYVTTVTLLIIFTLGAKPLAQPREGATTSYVLPWSETVDAGSGGGDPPRLYGGFTHAPVNFEINASASDGIERVF